MKQHSEQYTRHLRSPQWFLLREKVLSRAQGACETCGTPSRLEVHHRHYDALGHEALADVVALCPACHERADRDRRIAAAAEARYEARLNGWATRRYGENWEDYRDREDVEKAFDAWLERRGDE